MEQHETLRMIAEHSAPEVAEAIVAAADRLKFLEQQVEDVSLIAKWRDDGERLFAKGGGLMFSLGAWWADRPWRNRDA